MTTEHTLYAALKRIMRNYAGVLEDAGCSRPEENTEYKLAMSALAEYEMTLGPLPDWAIAHNVTHDYLLGVQLFTRDGRRHGNAHIIDVLSGTPPLEQTTYTILTDAGSLIHNMTLSEVKSGWEAGDFISDPAAVRRRFMRPE